MAYNGSGTTKFLCHIFLMLYNVVFSHLHDVTIYYIFNETMSNTFDPIRRQIQYFYLGTPSTWSLRLIFNYAIELGTKTNLETLTLFVFPPIDLPFGHFEMRKEDRVLDSNFVTFYVWVRFRVCNGL